MDCEPLAGSLPDQPLEPTQEVALLTVQLSVDALPDVTVLGLAPRVTDGAAAVTVTIAVCAAEPPGPVHVRAKLLLADSGPVDCEPLTPTLPLQPPEATHELAPVALHVRVESPPLTTVVGSALSMIVGATAVTSIVALCMAEPAGPVQVRLKLVVAVRGPVDCEPLVGCGPLQPPEALQLVALTALQLSVELPSIATRLGLVESVRVGAAVALGVGGEVGLSEVPEPEPQPVRIASSAAHGATRIQRTPV